MWKLILNFFIGCVLGGACMGCSKDENVLNMEYFNSKTIKVVQYHSGKVVTEKKIDFTKDIKEELLQILQHVEWEKNFMSYAPRLYVRGDNFSITLINETIVLNQGGVLKVKPQLVGELSKQQSSELQALLLQLLNK